MCVILCSLKGDEINKDHLFTGFNNNPHGSGFMVAKDNNLIIEKGFFDFEDFYSQYEKYIGLPIVVHHRWATMGARNKENCHPFQFLNGEFDNKLQAAVAHNGHVNGHTEICSMSDTYNFVQKRLIPLTKKVNGDKWWENIGFKMFFQSALGNNNKLVFLDSDGKINIYNEKAGEWVEPESIWASNDSYKGQKYRSERSYLSSLDDDYAKFQRKKREEDEKNKPKTETSKILRPNFKQTENFEANEPKINKNSIVANDSPWKDISDEELKEIDSYLDSLNG